jgi:dTMP kinase
MQGKLIVIEGLDGAGKSTQIELLRKHLENKGIKCQYIHFPMMNKGIYGNLIAEFLRGEFGSVSQVHPKLVALLFANDRAEHIHLINNWLEEGYYVLADRYVNSNIAYQCAKTADAQEKEDLKNWILDFEFNFNKLPKPYKSIFLEVPFQSIINSLSNNRAGEDRDYLKGKKDIHEDSISLQENVYAQYKKMIAEQENFKSIDCSDENGNFKPINIIHQMVLESLNF